jgi:hypothetical protein
MSKEFSVKFELISKGKKQGKQETFFEFFVKHFGALQFSPRYKITIEVAK